jgi:hypothetical protein
MTVWDNIFLFSFWFWHFAFIFVFQHFEYGTLSVYLLLSFLINIGNIGYWYYFHQICNYLVIISSNIFSTPSFLSHYTSVPLMLSRSLLIFLQYFSWSILHIVHLLIYVQVHLFFVMVKSFLNISSF